MHAIQAPGVLPHFSNKKKKKNNNESEEFKLNNQNGMKIASGYQYKIQMVCLYINT